MIKDTEKRRRNNAKKNYEMYGEEVIAHMWAVHRFLLNKFGYISEEWHLSLQMLADNLNIFFQCRDRIKRDGIFVQTKIGQYDKHPLIKVQNDAQIQIVKLLQQYGLTPHAVGKLKNTEDDDNDLLNELLND